jgi:uncharacterized protein YndB with AHSA1/START domain
MTGDNTELVVERRVAASPATIFSFFADRDQWLRWQGVEADIDPDPAGSSGWTFGETDSHRAASWKSSRIGA